jgi:hypothetical protein
MPKSASLTRQEVFKAFWAFCVQLADHLNTDSLLAARGLHCYWRRHSLVVLLNAEDWELSVHRRQNAILCTVTGLKGNMWKAKIMPSRDGSAVFVVDHTTVAISDAAMVLFSIIAAFCKGRAGSDSSDAY